jgi:perosamine synthetase
MEDDITTVIKKYLDFGGEQPVFRQRGLFVEESHPLAERIARQGLYLPSGLAINELQIGQVAEALRKMLF